MLFGQTQTNFSIPGEFISETTRIFSFIIQTEERSTTDPEDVGHSFGKRIYFSIKSEQLSAYITDGFRALEYKTESRIQTNPVNFSISADDLVNLETGSGQQTLLQIQGNGLLAGMDTWKRNIKSFRKEKNIFGSIESIAKSGPVCQIRADLTEFRNLLITFVHENEILIEADSVKNNLALKKSPEQASTNIKCSVTGKDTIRYINPKLLQSFLLLGNNAESLVIRFFEPFMLSFCFEGQESLSFFLMPILKK